MGGVAAELCRDCGGSSLERRGFCPRCGSRAVEVGMVDGAATIWSVTDVYRAPAAMHDADPYRVGLVALVAGPRLMAALSDGIGIGDAVRVTRDDIDDPATRIDRVSR